MLSLSRTIGRPDERGEMYYEHPHPALQDQMPSESICRKRSGSDEIVPVVDEATHVTIESRDFERIDVEYSTSTRYKSDSYRRTLQ